MLCKKMKCALIYLIFLFILFVNAKYNDLQWNEFKSKYGKHYSTISEHQKRFDVFKANIKKILNHNYKYENGETTYKMGINRFSDMLQDEFLLCHKEGVSVPLSTGDNSILNYDFSNSFPDSFDWREKGAVLPPGQPGIFCNSAGWAFSIAGTVASHLFIYNGTLEQMSPQYIIDCCSFSDGCNVPVPLNKAYHCLAVTGGISGPDNYVYFNGIQGPCLNDPNFPITYSSMFDINETMMVDILVNRGPLNVIVDSTNLHSYSSGIVSATDCEPEVKVPLAAIVIGYGTENGTDFWIIQNSWGTDWGEDGYFRLVRNQKACGINKEVYIPLIDVGL